MADPNLELLRTAVSRLGSLANEMVFVGGCATGLLITDEASPENRPTLDVDAIIEAVTYSQYVDFEKRLGEIGFKRDLSEGAPICRWMMDEVLLDILPIDGNILGFKNSWYEGAVKTAVSHNIGAETDIRAASPPYFIATKLEAFADRGNNDFLGSRDIEDVISVINGREELVDDIKNADEGVREYISRSVSELLKKRAFVDSLSGHLNPDTDRLPILLERLEQISEL